MIFIKVKPKETKGPVLAVSTNALKSPLKGSCAFFPDFTIGKQ